jgi:hypothetical protein
VQDDQLLREQLTALLDGGNAHIPFDRVINDFPMDQINIKPDNIPYSAWQLLEHIRIAQRDILDFIRETDYKSPSWPSGYWPSIVHADKDAWNKTILSIKSDLDTLRDIVNNPKTDLDEPLPHGEKYTILREILIIADHNAYHLGELLLLRRVLGAWS